MKIISIVGARPQFIKLAPLCRELRLYKDFVCHRIINTGQHYDANMSRDFFCELDLPLPDYDLGIGSGTHAEQTGKALEKIEVILKSEAPDHVIVFGDTNATLSGVLAASKLNIRISHIEAGLRSFNRKMPEEINRIIADRLATYLFCPDETSVRNLSSEGISKGVFNVGDVMVDQIYYLQSQGTFESRELPRPPYIFMTLHRQETSLALEELREVMITINDLSNHIPVIFPVHPRMKNIISSLSIDYGRNFNRIEPLGYTETINYLKNAQYVITDSGGLQKEAYILKIPCVTLRTETEWVDTLKNNWNQLVGLDISKLKVACNNAFTFDRTTAHTQVYGKGDASKKIINHIVTHDKTYPSHMCSTS